MNINQLITLKIFCMLLTQNTLIATGQFPRDLARCLRKKWAAQFGRTAPKWGKPMNIVKLGAAAAVMMLAVGTAEAGTIVYDDPSDYTVNQGLAFNGGSIPGSRSNPNNMFDGNP